MSREEALSLYREAPLEELCRLAINARFAHVPEPNVSYQIDRNVNYTNVCLSGCKFCNFHCRPDEPEKAYTLSFEDYLPKIAELKSLGGDQLLLQGGLHPRYGIEWYETLFRRLKEAEPSLRLNALGPPEIAHIARISKLPYRDVLVRLRDAGLDTLPGAGAEILSDRVRRFLSPAKPSARQWLDVMREAHTLGMSTTVTMVYGHIETLEERIDHLLALRARPASAPSSAGRCSSPERNSNGWPRTVDFPTASPFPANPVAGAPTKNSSAPSPSPASSSTTSTISRPPGSPSAWKPASEPSAPAPTIWARL